jgi:hypothetical protein
MSQPTPPTLNEDGILHIPMLMMTTIFVVTSLALWGILHHWKNLVDTQLRLDRCTGEVALNLKSKLQTIAAANRQITALRLTEAMNRDPRIDAVLQASIAAEALRQEGIRLDWKIHQVGWAGKMGCAERGDHSDPLPSLSWTRELPDELGQRPLNMNDFPSSYRIQVAHLPRASAAEVSLGDSNEETSWHAEWAPPSRFLRPGLD